MTEELVPGLVRVSEERLGIAGRPLTTLMVLSAVVGITSWGVKQFFTSIVDPVLRIFGLHADSELVGAITILATLTLFIVASIFVTVYGVDWLRRRGVNARLQAQEKEIQELRNQLESSQRERENG